MLKYQQFHRDGNLSLVFAYLVEKNILNGQQGETMIRCTIQFQTVLSVATAVSSSED